MSKDLLPIIKVCVYNVPISEKDSNCNSILRPADSYGATTELKKCRVQLGMYFLSPLYNASITSGGYRSVPAFVSDRSCFH